MRDLSKSETSFVAGAGSTCTPPPPPTCTPTKAKHANNGFGNGANDGVPGRSNKTDFDR